MEPDSKDTATRIWILRHGRSTLNDAQIFQGCGVPGELTVEGIEAAKAAGERLGSEEIDVIYTSPLQRAAQTAELVRATLRRGQQAPVLEMDDALREMELPQWQGLPYTTVREQFAEQYRCFQQNPEGFSMTDPDRGEIRPVLDMEKRVRDFLSAVTRRKACSRILLVTHGGPASVVLLTALRLPLRHIHSVQIMHGGLGCLSVQRWPDRVWIDTVNEISESTRSLPKLKSGKSGLRLLLVASGQVENPAICEDWFVEMLRELPVHRALAIDQEGLVLAMRLLGPGQWSSIENCTALELGQALDRYRSSQSPDRLSNLLITARGDLIAAVLAHCMGWNGTGLQTKVESCRGLSVIHVPGSTEQPVLQAMNVCRPVTTAKEEIAGVGW